MYCYKHFISYTVVTETFYHKHDFDILLGISDLTTVGGRIRFYRLSHGLLQEEVAAIAGTDVCTIKRYENNQCKHSLDICNKITKAIRVDPSLLYDDYLAFIASEYGYKIKSIRKKLNLTQELFSKLMGVHRKTILRWEKETLCPSREHYNLLAQLDDIQDY
ncbi:helix-turn-helix domain-containing protein [Brassicibacter mesophilus]|uniref:helix-turn-helix domain-containing protein n=1 Tax=Brassicibacter mesophilus TaxID=745119 RepID=UPI003D20550E